MGCATNPCEVPALPSGFVQENSFLHIQRKHGQVNDTTSQCHLQSTSIDQINNLYAVRGLSVSEHAQHKTWGQQHVTRCEMDVCFSTLEYLALEHNKMFGTKKSSY